MGPVPGRVRTVRALVEAEGQPGLEREEVVEIGVQREPARIAGRPDRRFEVTVAGDDDARYIAESVELAQHGIQLRGSPGPCQIAGHDDDVRLALDHRVNHRNQRGRQLRAAVEVEIGQVDEARHRGSGSAASVARSAMRASRAAIASTLPTPGTRMKPYGSTNRSKHACRRSWNIW